MILKDSAAIVTGGASGLGEATARLLAEEGVKVTLFDMNSERGAQVAGEIGGHFCQVDITDWAAVDQAFASARAQHGQERILINCAGAGNAMRTASRARDTGEIRVGLSMSARPHRARSAPGLGTGSSFIANPA